VKHYAPLSTYTWLISAFAVLLGLASPLPAQPLSDQDRATFEEVWRLVDRQYPFLQQSPVDWQARYASYRQKLPEVSKPQELKALIEELIAPFHDPQLKLYTSADRAQAGPQLSTAWHSLRLQTLREQGYSLPEVYRDGDGHNVMEYALSGRFGYLYVYKMEGLSPRQTALMLEEAFAAFRGMEGLIVDLRGSQGEQKEMALALASFFNPSRQLAFYQQKRPGPLPEDTDAIYMEAVDSDLRFEAPVMLLATSQSGKAAQLFTLATKDFKQVKHLGQSLGGKLAEKVRFGLANGWSLDLPVLACFSADKEMVTPYSLHPDIYLLPKAEQSKDVILLRALKQLRVPYLMDEQYYKVQLEK
jgi:carboxyl-terminal processing protease